MRVILITLLLCPYSSLLCAAAAHAPVLNHSLSDSTEPFKPEYFIEITQSHLEEMKKKDVRLPTLHPLDVRELPKAFYNPATMDLKKYHPCSLTATSIIKGLCSIYITHEGEKTFTLQLSQFTDELTSEATEAYRNLDYSFNGQTGEREPSLSEISLQLSATWQTILKTASAQELRERRHDEHNKIRNYHRVFKEGIAAKEKEEKRSAYLIPKSYVQKIQDLERNLKTRPNPFLIEWLHLRIEALEKHEKTRKLWS